MKRFWLELRLTVASELFRWALVIIMEICPQPDLTIYAEGAFLISKALIDKAEHIEPTVWVPCKPKN